MREPTKRWDAEGRDITNLPGLWSEDDRVPVGDLDEAREAARRYLSNWLFDDWDYSEEITQAIQHVERKSHPWLEG